MAYTINLDGESIPKEELDLLRIKQAILDKLRVRFGEKPNQMPWNSAQNAATETKSLRRQ